MKNKWLWTLCFAALKCFSNQFYLYADSDFSVSHKINLPFAEFRTSGRDNDINFGFASFSDKICPKYPFVIKCGNLSTGGAFSTMNSPLLSSASSPFDSGNTSVNCLTTSLPGISSFSKPVSVFFQIGYNNKKNVLSGLKLNCFYSPEDDIVLFSCLQKISILKNKLVLQSSQAFGELPYDENTSSSWFIPEDLYYHSGKHFCSLFQLGITAEAFKTTFTINTYESPFGQFDSVFRVNSSLKSNHFFFTFSTVYIPTENILTSSQKKLHECLQFKESIQYKTVFGEKLPWFLKSGICAYTKVNLTGTEHDADLSAGFQVSSGFTSLSFTGTISSIIHSTQITVSEFELDSISLKLKNSWYFTNITPSVSFGINIAPSNNAEITKPSLKYSGNVNLYLKKFLKFSGTAGFSLTDKAGEITTKSFTTNCSISFPTKIYTCTVKISANINI